MFCIRTFNFRSLNCRMWGFWICFPNFDFRVRCPMFRNVKFRASDLRMSMFRSWFSNCQVFIHPMFGVLNVQMPDFRTYTFWISMFGVSSVRVLLEFRISYFPISDCLAADISVFRFQKLGFSKFWFRNYHLPNSMYGCSKLRVVNFPKFELPCLVTCLRSVF